MEKKEYKPNKHYIALSVFTAIFAIISFLFLLLPKTELIGIISLSAVCLILVFVSVVTAVLSQKKYEIDDDGIRVIITKKHQHFMAWSEVKHLYLREDVRFGYYCFLSPEPKSDDAINSIRIKFSRSARFLIDGVLVISIPYKLKDAAALIEGYVSQKND